jgi:hypothetical protein
MPSTASLAEVANLAIGNDCLVSIKSAGRDEAASMFIRILRPTPEKLFGTATAGG